MADERESGFQVEITGDGLSVKRDVDIDTAWQLVSVVFQHARGTSAAASASAAPAAAPAPTASTEAPMTPPATPMPESRPQPAVAGAQPFRPALNAVQRLQRESADSR